jgi:hypothetical protein
MGKIEITLSDFILAITFLALLWYSWETRQMRKEIVEQTKFQLAPFLTVGFDFKSKWLFVINYGEATARNIEVSCSPPPYDQGSFLKISTIYKGEMEYLRTKIGKGDDDLSCGLDAFRGAGQTVFHLKYQNIFDKVYESEVVLKGANFFLTEFKAINQKRLKEVS